MLKKEITRTVGGEFGETYHIKTVWKVLGITFYVIKTEYK